MVGVCLCLWCVCMCTHMDSPGGDTLPIVVHTLSEDVKLGCCESFLVSPFLRLLLPSWVQPLLLCPTAVSPCPPSCLPPLRPWSVLLAPSSSWFGSGFLSHPRSALHALLGCSKMLLTSPSGCYNLPSQGNSMVPVPSR